MKYPDLEKRLRKLEEARKAALMRPRLLFVRPGFIEADELAKQPPFAADEEPWFIVLTKTDDVLRAGKALQ